MAAAPPKIEFWGRLKMHYAYCYCKNGEMFGRKLHMALPQQFLGSFEPEVYQNDVAVGNREKILVLVRENEHVGEWE
jgi:hypothetical protein